MNHSQLDNCLIRKQSKGMYLLYALLIYPIKYVECIVLHDGGDRVICRSM